MTIIKKLTAVTSALFIASAMMTSTACGSKKSSSVTEEKESCNEALTNWFAAANSADGAAAALEYTCPAAYIDYMKSQGIYDQYISDTNSDAAGKLEKSGASPSIKEIKESTELTDEQLEAVAHYFEYTFEVTDISVSRGEELEYSCIDLKGKDSDETVCVVELDGEGKKVIKYTAKALMLTYGNK